jgi:predicted CopG family antitoxin
MPPAPKHNWAYLYDVYQKLCEEKSDTSVAEFSRQNNVEEGSCRMAFNRIRKKIAKRTARTTRTNQTENKRNNSDIFTEISPTETREIVQQVCSARVVAVHAKVLANLIAAMDRLDIIQGCEKKIKPETMRDIKDAYQSVNELLRALRDIMPFILELKDRTGLEDIISRLQGREYDVTQAALEISKMGANLPEALKIMLSKTPPVMIANNFEMTNLDELDQRALEALKQVQWQHECFLPQRRDEVIELKKELKGADSFAPENEVKQSKGK